MTVEQAHWTPAAPSSRTLHRALGDSEYAFFKSSSTGLGDMFLHMALRAPPEIMRPERVRIAWCTLRVAHPLLTSKVVEGEDATGPRFCFTPPASVQDALDDAERALHFRESSKDELIFNYMNGPRTLSNEHLSYLVISQRPSEDDEYDLLMCAPHFIGDGTSLHQSTHELLVLLASPKSDDDLRQELEARLEHTHSIWPQVLPCAVESRLPVPGSSLARAACKVNFLQTKQSEIGDHVFPRTRRGAQRTRLVEHSFDEEQTREILSACKRNGVSVNNALFALCNAAWARTRSEINNNKLPMMIYSAINLRPHLPTPPTHIDPAATTTYWFLALTYFTVTLPAFPPSSPAAFWHRARLAKSHTARSVTSPFLPSRALATSAQRAGARGPAPPAPAPAPPPQLPPHARTRTPSPSRALLGLSLIGNLDHIYTPAAYTRPRVQLHSVTTASRQREGGLLVLEHTFGGRLWLHLCWDEMGFEEGVVEAWWARVVSGVGEFLK